MIDAIEKVAQALKDCRTQLRADNDAARAKRGLWPDRHLHPTDEQYAQAAIAAIKGIRDE